MSHAHSAASSLVLSGGAAYAAYEVGVAKALLTGASAVTNFRPLHPRSILGTSAGALNATVLVAELERGTAFAVEYLESVWRQQLADRPDSCGNGAYRFRGDLVPFFDSGCYASNPLNPFVEASNDAWYFARDALGRARSFLNSRDNIARRLLQLVNLHTVFSLEPFIKMLPTIVRADAVLRSPVSLGVVTTDWQTGESRVFGNSDLTPDRWMSILLASASVPGLPPVDIDGVPHADGAYVANTPIIPAIESGADCLHVVYLDPDPKSVPIESLESTIGLIDKMYLLMVASTFNRDITIVREVNRGLSLLQGGRYPASLNRAQLLSLTRSLAWADSASAAGVSLRPITVHRYRPRENLGGLLGRMNFDYSNIAELIEAGYRDAVSHDCEANHCVFP